MNYEAQFIIKPILQDEIKKNKLNKEHKKPIKSIDSTRDLSHETIINSQNINQNRL